MHPLCPLTIGVASGPTPSARSAVERGAVTACLVLVTGAGPGLGKSTLARAVASILASRGIRTQLFEEAEIKAHPAFVSLWGEFQATGQVTANALIDSAGDYINRLDAASVEVGILDALFPYLPSLLAWGYSDVAIAAFFEQLGAVFGARPVIELHLVGDLTTALARATGREADGWLEAMISKLAAHEGASPVVDECDAAKLLEALARRSRGLLEEAPWPVVFVDANAGISGALETSTIAIDEELQLR